MPPTLTTKSSDAISAPRFSIVTKALAGEGTDEEPRFRATASSTIVDRDGDEISLKALQQMAAKFQAGVTIFTDHENKVANAYGTTDHAEITSGGQDDKGNPIWDLQISGPVNVPSPNAMQLHRSISGGYVKLGCSIDAFVLDHTRKKSGGLAIEGLDVFAASIVGVPANQRSWTQKAVRAIKSFRPDEEDDTAMPPETTETVETVTTTTVTKDVTTDTNWLDANASTTELKSESLDTADIVAETAEDATEKAASCPDCGKGHDAEGCENGYHTAEKSVDSEPGVQESDAETPETAPTEEEGTDTPAETDEETAEKALTYSAEDVAALLKHVRAQVTEIGRLREENAALTEKVASLTTENNTVFGEVELAKQVIEKVMATPLQAKTAGYVNDFTEAHKLFDPDIADFLTKRGAIDA